MKFLPDLKKNTHATQSEDELRLHRCAFTGHRPEKLCGYEGRIICELRKEILAAIADGYTTFISGGSRGVDLWAADIVIELRRKNKDLKLILAIPFKGFENDWSVDWNFHFQQVRKKADWVEIVSQAYSQDAYMKRNVWLVNHSSRVIGVWNGLPSGTKNTLDYANSQGIPCRIVQV